MRIQEDIAQTLKPAEIVTLDNLVIGARVRRGPDWEWGTQDNNGEGLIRREVDRFPGWVEVIWGGVCAFTYRIGAEDKYDLEYV